MKRNIILGLTVAGLSLATTNVLATSDDSQYPAANFQPKVVYVDKDIVKESTSKRKVVFDPKYPAADFQPQVVYIDNDAVKSATVAVRKKAEIIFDPKYPAAYFEPKVIYP